MRVVQQSIRPSYANFTRPKHAASIQLPSRILLPKWTRSFHATTSVRELDLAYRLHDNNGNAKGDPIVIVHGLFGSKRNNQSVGK